MQTIFNKYFPFNGEIIQQEDVGIREWVKTNRDFHIRGKILWKKKESKRESTTMEVYVVFGVRILWGKMVGGKSSVSW